MVRDKGIVMVFMKGSVDEIYINVMIKVKLINDKWCLKSMWILFW